MLSVAAAGEDMAGVSVRCALGEGECDVRWARVSLHLLDLASGMLDD